MIRAVLFDVDGVLVPPYRFRDALERDHGITPAMTLPFFKGPFLECVLGRADLLAALPPYLATWGFQGTAAQFVTEWLQTEHLLDQDVLAIAAEVRAAGFPCYLASTQEARRAGYLMAEMGLGDRFDGRFFSCDVGLAKPDADYYRTVAERLALPGNELLFFDDVEANVAGARSAGWHAEPFTTVDRLRADLARYLDPWPGRGSDDRPATR